MKRQLLAVLGAAFLALGFSSAAHAVEWNCDYGDPVPADTMSHPIHDNVIITGTGACSIANPIYVVDGKIDIHVGGALMLNGTLQTNTDIFLFGNNDVTVNADVRAGGHFEVDSNAGNININGDVYTAQSGGGGNMVADSYGSFHANNIFAGSPAGAAQSVAIFVNGGGGSSEFVIGGSGGNGVSGVIDVSGTYTGRTEPNAIYSGLSITNGTSSSSGDIRLVSMSAINVNNSNSRSGILLLDANSGTITLPSGSLQSDGAAGQGAGLIVLMAETVTTVNGTIISASQDPNAAGTVHGVVISANTINVAGSNGLEIHADGNGVDSTYVGFVHLHPKGAIHYSACRTPILCDWVADTSNQFYTDHALTITGTGSFHVTANGDHESAFISGYPVVFNTTTASIEAKGSTDHNIMAGFWGTQRNGMGLNISSTGIVSFDASASTSGGTGGVISIVADQTQLTSPEVNFLADGPSVGDGSGGIVDYWTNALTVGASSKVRLHANGKGSGNGGTVSFLPGAATLRLGTGNGQVQLQANGGSSSGDAGTIVSWNTGTMLISTGAAVEAKVVGTSGNGGSITLQPSGGFGVLASATGVALDVTGKGSGNGGEILVWGGWANLTLGNSAGSLQLSANSSGTGNGGTIELAYFTNLALNTINASGGTDSGSDGEGGTINIHDVVTYDAQSAVLQARGHNAGQGGVIMLNSAGNTIDLTQAEINASGGDLGLGGTFVANHTAPFDVNQVVNVDAGSISTDEYAGSISLNGVTCQQWRVANSWPTEYWNCAAPEDDSGTHHLPVAVLSSLPNAAASAISGSIENFHLYVMTDAAQWNAFFGGALNPQVAGYTFYFGAGFANRAYTAIFENSTLSSSGYTARTATQITGNTVHEAGHLWEIVESGEASSGPYITALQDDFAHLNAAGAPCGSGGPFVGVTDMQTGQPFCNGTTLNNPGGIYTGLSNAEIAIRSTQNLADNIWLGALGFHEPWAQAYAFEVYTHGLTYPGQNFDTTADGLMRNGYFQCGRQRAAQLAGGSFTPSYSCN
jgi:hypothetical protein